MIDSVHLFKIIKKNYYRSDYIMENFDQPEMDFSIKGYTITSSLNGKPQFQCLLSLYSGITGTYAFDIDEWVGENNFIKVHVTSTNENGDTVHEFDIDESKCEIFLKQILFKAFTNDGKVMFRYPFNQNLNGDFDGDTLNTVFMSSADRNRFLGGIKSTK